MSMRSAVKSVSVAVAVAAILGLSTPAVVGAQATSFTDLPAQPLAQAIQTVARQAGVNILVDPKLVEGRNAPAVKMQASLDATLSLLLEGSGLVPRHVDEKTITLVPAKSSALSEVEPAIETVNVFASLEKPLSVGSKSGQSLRETPKSVTIVTRERIEAQNLSSLVDTLNQTTGVTVQSYSSGGTDSFFFSRGYRVNTIQIDGGAPAFTGGFGMFLVPDMASYDHIEMLRGVDGMYTGAGGPGGVINMVRKKPKDHFELQTNLSVGRWDNYRADVDLTGPIALDGRLRGRLAAAYVDKGYFVDRASTDKVVLYGVSELDVTDSLLLELGISYENRDEGAYSNNGLPRYADGRDLQLPRSTNLSPDWSHWDFETKEVFARLEQRYGDDGALRLNVARIEQTSEQRDMFTRGTVDPLTRSGVRARAIGGDFMSTQYLADVSASGTFPLFGRRHRYTVGTDYASIDGSGQRQYFMPSYPNNPPVPVDVFNFDPGLYPQPTGVLSGIYPENGQAQNGFYATVGWQLADPLRLTMGARYSEFRYRQTFRSVAADGALGTPNVTRYDDKAFIPSVALSYDFADDWSVYASYAETFEVQANLLSAAPDSTPANVKVGGPLDPVTGKGYEFGVKGELFGVLNLAGAVYRVEREGQGIQDALYANLAPGELGASCCFLAQANIISEGFDAEISGTVLPGWQLFAGYTYNTNKSVDDPTDGYSSGKYFLNLTPRHMFKAWTTWQLPGELSRWTLNGGVVAQTESSILGQALAAAGSSDLVSYKFSQGSYALWNASVQYRFNDHWTVALYGENLTDETYYQVLGLTDRENVYGMPRSYVLKVSARW